MHVIALPAADEYSMPASVEVHASVPLVETVGLMWAGKVRIGGVPKSFVQEREDPHSGEIRKVKVLTADNSLFAVE